MMPPCKPRRGLAQWVLTEPNAAMQQTGANRAIIGASPASPAPRIFGASHERRRHRRCQAHRHRFFSWPIHQHPHARIGQCGHRRRIGAGRAGRRQGGRSHHGLRVAGRPWPSPGASGLAQCRHFRCCGLHHHQQGLRLGHEGGDAGA